MSTFLALKKYMRVKKREPLISAVPVSNTPQAFFFSTEIQGTETLGAIDFPPQKDSGLK